MTNNNMWDCADMPPCLAQNKNVLDDSNVFKLFFFVNFWYLSVYL
jgi:hypothetical protein